MNFAAEDPLREAMAEIVKAAMHGGSLTRQFLAFSRRQISQPRDIQMNDVVRDFEKMLKRLIGEDIEVVLSLHPDAGALTRRPLPDRAGHHEPGDQRS